MNTVLELFKQIAYVFTRAVGNFILARKTFRPVSSNIVRVVRQFPGESGQMKPYLIRYLEGNFVYRNWLLRQIEYVLTTIELMVRPSLQLMAIVYEHSELTGTYEHVIKSGCTMRAATGYHDADIVNAIHEASRSTEIDASGTDSWSDMSGIPHPFTTRLDEYCDLRLGQLVTYFDGLHLTRFTGSVSRIYENNGVMCYEISTKDRGAFFVSHDVDSNMWANNACSADPDEFCITVVFKYIPAAPYDPPQWDTPFGKYVRVCGYF